MDFGRWRTILPSYSLRSHTGKVNAVIPRGKMVMVPEKLSLGRVDAPLMHGGQRGEGQFSRFGRIGTFIRLGIEQGARCG